MTEWEVVGVIVVLVGLVCAVVGPVLKLNGNITRMNAILERLDRDHMDDMRKNAESHDRLWKHNEKQDAQLDDHDRRILTLEHKGGQQI